MVLIVVGLFSFVLNEGSCVATSNMLFSDNFLFYKGNDAVEERILGIILPETPEKPTESRLSGNVEQVELEIKKVKGCSCIVFAKEYFPTIKDEMIYSPFYLWRNYKEYGFKKSDKPVLGGIIITRENTRYGHIGIVEKITEDTIKILDRNYRPCIITHRELEIDDPLIVGYLYY